MNLAATSVPYLQRLDTLDELAELKRPALVSLVVRALARVAYDGPSDVIHLPPDQAPEPEWNASSSEEYMQYTEESIGRLRTIAAERDPGLRAALFDAAKEVSPVLAGPAESRSVIGFFTELLHAYPELREPLRKQIAEVIRRTRERLQPKHLQTLRRFHARFEDISLDGRLRQHVGARPWERDGSPDFAPLATALLSARDVLAAEWSWLTSGEAASAWELGKALAAADPHGELAEDLPRFPEAGRDLRVLCGYVSVQRETFGDAWYERWVLAQFERRPQPHRLLVEVAWRCGVTERVAMQMADLLRGTRLGPALVGQLMYGKWDGASADALEGLLRAMIEAGHAETAVSILQRRMEGAVEDIDRWAPLALELVQDLDLIRCRQMPNHHWQKVAEMLIADHPREIAAAIFRAHAKRDGRLKTWFLQHERAVVDVLDGCVARDAVGVLQELLPYLWPPREAVWFVSGFPAGVIERMPPDDVLEWIAQAPAGQAAERAALLARLTDKRWIPDESLAGRIIAKYGHHPVVDQAFFSHHVSGGGWGPISRRWQAMAQELDEIAAHASRPGLRLWARRTAGTLRKMANQERQREEEEELLVRSGA